MSEMPGERNPWSVPVAVANVPETGSHVTMSADEATRTEIAELAGLRSLPRLEASFDVSRQGSDGLRVVGRVSAAVGQTCVVTLEPIENTVEETVDLVFKPAQEPIVAAEEPDERDLASDEEPEAMVGGKVDLGAIAVEFLLLGIDPYPRKAGVVFDAPPADDGPSHAFAALAALKRGLQPDEK